MGQALAGRLAPVWADEFMVHVLVGGKLVNHPVQPGLGKPSRAAHARRGHGLMADVRHDDAVWVCLHPGHVIAPIGALAG